ncbi:protein kinase [Hamadaea sp. NPDC051192]|uniref:protein kinase domain-containing protein n=1 Tax=Hamadaea sp. NPDC051192 TaxID=3154940 RepID=UPI003425868A
MTPHQPQARRSLPDGIRLPDEITQLTLIAERPGSRVWKVAMAGGDVVAVKYTTGEAGQSRSFAHREAAVLTHVDPDRLFAFSHTAHGTWLAVEWDSSPSLAHRWQHADTHRSAALHAAAQAATTLAALHEAGWRHADLQPGHILVPEHGPARIIDWAIGQGPADDLPAIAYRGGYAHLTAPEIAAQLLDTPASHHVTLTTAAEVYTFGATVFASWAKLWPRDYKANPASLNAPEIYTAITDPASLRPMPEGWPSVATLLTATLDPNPANRPTMSETRDELIALADHQRPSPSSRHPRVW